MMRVERGARCTAKPDVYICHSSKDKDTALQLATTLKLCSVNVWLDDWELEVGQSLIDKIGKAMNESRYIAILISENCNKTVWTKTEYKKALTREQKEGRTVMLPLVVGQAEIPDFLEDKIYIDLRKEFFTGIVKLVAMVHGISRFRISQALAKEKPKGVSDVWSLLQSMGFEPYVVLEKDDFDEVLKHGGQLQREGYAKFSPDALLSDANVSNHVKSLLHVFAANYNNKSSNNNARSADWLNSWRPATPSELSWPIANHNSIRDAFATLITPNPTCRILTIRGPSEIGKSLITNQMLANALKLSKLACGRFDFKGGTDFDNELRRFVQHLYVPIPPPSTLLNERFGQVLQAISNRAQLTLLIFDTYEAAAKPQQDWVEKELLSTVARASQLRVVIAGQYVPRHAGAVWADFANATFAKPVPIGDWVAYGKEHRPDLDLCPAKVETIREACRDSPSLLAQIFGPDI